MRKNKAVLFALTCSLVLGAFTPAAYAAGADVPSAEVILEETVEEPDIITSIETEDTVDDSHENDPSSNVDVVIDEPVQKSRPAESAAAVKGDGVEEGVSSFTERILYTTYDRESDPKQYLDDSVTIDGTEYELKETGQPVYIKQEEIVPKQMFYETEVFTGDEAEYLPDETVTQDGVTYQLISKELIEQTAQERSEYKETVVEYKGVEAGIVLPQEKEITFTDVDTKQEITTTLPYVKEQVVAEHWSEDFEFPITISGYDADVFVLNGKEVPKDADLMDYADDFLEILHLDPESYKITSITLGDSYEEDGVVKRKATATGSKYVRDINVTYGGTVTLPSIVGKVWSCMYEEAIPDDQRVMYTMAVDATYESAVQTAEVTVDSGFLDTLIGYITAAYEAVVEAFREHPVISSIPLIAIAALIAFLITRKVKNRCIYNKELKCPYKKRTKDTCKSCVHYRNRQKV